MPTTCIVLNTKTDDVRTHFTPQLVIHPRQKSILNLYKVAIRLISERVQTDFIRPSINTRHAPSTIYLMTQSHSYNNSQTATNSIGRLLLDATCEVLWPTRCALCDTPGTLMCHPCATNLPYLDQLTACPTCGAPWGRLVCTECNSYNLKKKELTTLALDGCASALIANEESIHLITLYKDGGERRLADLFAHMLCAIIPPHWMREAVIVPIPATNHALVKRGFDHIDTFAALVAQNLGLPYAPLLQVAKTGDQRKLSGAQRFKNMRGAFSFKDSSYPRVLNCNIILIDDVFTTGATLYSAAELMRNAQARHIYAATIARV